VRPTLRVSFLLVLPVGLVACEGTTPTAPAPTDAPAVVLESSTSQSPEPTAAPAEGAACENEYLPIVKGATWTYEGTTSRGDYRENAIILDVKGDRFELGVTLGGISYQEAWLCTEDGLLQLDDPTSPFTAFYTGPDATVSIATIGTDGVTLPTRFEVGDEWDQTTQLEINGDIYSGPSTIHHEFSAVRSEEVTVAGTVWQAVVVEVSSHMDVLMSPRFAMDYETTQWFVRGVGLVKLEGEMGMWEVGGELVEPGLEYDVSFEMVGYSVP
jgi:hypothetical protein